MPKYQTKGKSFILILSLALITTAVWIGVDVYNVFSQETVSNLSLEEIKITDPNIDIPSLEALQKRESPPQAQLSQLPDITITIEPEIESEIEPGKEASPASLIQP